MGRCGSSARPSDKRVPSTLHSWRRRRAFRSPSLVVVVAFAATRLPPRRHALERIQHRDVAPTAAAQSHRRSFPEFVMHARTVVDGFCCMKAAAAPATQLATSTLDVSPCLQIRRAMDAYLSCATEAICTDHATPFALQEPTR
ncbi:hypothetical protein H310_12889 [Aphanomyces invadans]|uniref:Uncharacterized protein n=1 Tax=Aphanomyces invadans TaxID=157072 RepID=A0A024TGF9_9STRA|nr:hypothetical protein H310_12889 [Aphanomyces invadans]ETV93094.1 hypothetical protein H310_12889 [Aphanomyces invadans]|eukprot:XP_008878359.1 hypothetical protein H310_12889 [Aphanomyces invadans]